jgi:hypothetical protein
MSGAFGVYSMDSRIISTIFLNVFISTILMAKLVNQTGVVGIIYRHYLPTPDENDFESLSIGRDSRHLW